MATVTISLELRTCREDDCQSKHPNIKAYTAAIKLIPAAAQIGDIKGYVFSKAAMDGISPNQMWEECQKFDELHTDTKLDKIENFLANESFLASRERAIADAETILFIDQVWLERKFRGHDFGLAAVQQAVEALLLPTKTVAMLQAGAIRDCGSGDASDAGEKLARHWGRLGFEAWSDSDDSWLLLLLADRGIVEHPERPHREGGLEIAREC